MRILNPDWLLKLPHDYELKKYILLSACQRFENEISNTRLFSTLSEVEFHLNELYKFKYAKDEEMDKLKVVSGINLDLMDLEYEYLDEVDELETIYDVAEYGIYKLEKIHSKIRQEWRKLAAQIRVTEIPDKKPTKKQGIVFVVLEDKIKLYTYIKPENLKEDWRNFTLHERGEVENTLRNIAQIISASERQSDLDRFWRMDTKGIDLRATSYEDAILPVVRYNLYHRLRVS